MVEINGYEYLDSADIPYYRGKAHYLRHRKTGLLVLVIDNKDEEAFFSYIVNTTCENNTGVFHIIEHTVLSGSEKYQVRDAFTELYKRGCPTFLNAFTGVDRTYYPASSVIEKDFDELFRVYTDCVFSPLLRREAFEQEGIRISSSPEVHFEGVVFSEMQGAMSQHESVASRISTRHLFPGTSYEYESGGDPRAICTLTYEEFLDTYRRYYRPSNMALLLYGDIDYKKKLEELDKDYLCFYDDRNGVRRPFVSPRWKEPRKETCYSLSMDEEHEGLSSVILSWRLFPISDRRSSMLLSILVDILLGSPGSPLYKAILDSGMCEDISTESGMAPDFPDSIFSVGMYGVAGENVDKVESYILDALEKIAGEGISEIEIETALRRYEFSLREIQGGNPNGMRILFRIDKSILSGRNPIEDLYPDRDFEDVRRILLSDRCYLSSWIRDNLVLNPHRLCSIIVMDSERAEKEASEEISRVLKSRMKEVDKEEEFHLQKYLDGEILKDDTSNFQTLGLEDIESKEFKKTIGSKSDRIVLLDEYSQGVIYADAYFDVSDFSLEELKDLNFLSRLMSMCSVEGLSMSEFSTLLRFNTGGYSFYLESGTAEDLSERAFLAIRLKLLEENAREAFELVRRLLFEGLFLEKEIRAALTDIRTEYKSNVVQNAVSYTLSLAAAPLSSSLSLGESLSGIEYWETVAGFEKDIHSLVLRLEKLRSKLLDASRLTLELTGDEEQREFRADLGKLFFSYFEDKGMGECEHHGRREHKKGYFYILPTPVNYISYAALYPDRSVETMASLRLFFSIISQGAVFEKIRAKGGAYGAGASFNTDDNVMFFYSYRDPRLEESIEDFLAAVKEEKFTYEKLEDAKKKIKSGDLKPLGPSQKALIQTRRRLYEVSDEFRLSFRKALMEVDLEDLEKLRDRIIEIFRTTGVVAALSRNPMNFSSDDMVVRKLPS